MFPVINMSRFFKNSGTASNPKKRERKSTPKIIAMKEMAGLNKTILKKKNENPPSRKLKLPYYVTYHERKDGLVMKTWRCSKCSGFISAEKKECSRCIAKLLERMQMDTTRDSIAEIGNIRQIKKKKNNSKVDEIVNTKSKTYKKAHKDGVKGKTVVGFKTNSLKKLKTKPLKPPKSQAGLKTVQQKKSPANSSKKVVGSLKNQLSKAPKKSNKVAEGMKLNISKKVKSDLSKATKLQNFLTNTPAAVEHISQIIEMISNESTRGDSEIPSTENTPKQILNTPEKKIKQSKDSVPKPKIISKRKSETSTHDDRKVSKSDSEMAKSKKKQMVTCVENRKKGGSIEKKTAKSKITLAEPLYKSVDAIAKICPAAITNQKLKKRITKFVNPDSNRSGEEIQNMRSTINNQLVERSSSIEKENHPENTRDSFFSYLNLEQITLEEFSPTHIDIISSRPVVIDDVLLDTNILGKDCFSGLLNSPNIEIIQEKDRSEKN